MYLQITNTVEEENMLFLLSDVHDFKITKDFIEFTTSNNDYYLDRNKYVFSFLETPTIIDKNFKPVVAFPTSFYNSVSDINDFLNFNERGVFRIKNTNTKKEFDIPFKQGESVNDKIINYFGFNSTSDEFIVIKMPF